MNLNEIVTIYGRALILKPPRPNGCKGCQWYIPSYRGFEDLYPEPPECRKHPQYMNLKTFPFRNKPKCWEESVSYISSQTLEES